MINAGPAPGLVPSGLPAAAMTTTAKIPEPIIAPTPKMIKSQTPKVFSKPPFAAFAIASSRFLRVIILVSNFFIIQRPFFCLYAFLVDSGKLKDFLMEN